MNTSGHTGRPKSWANPLGEIQFDDHVKSILLLSRKACLLSITSTKTISKPIFPKEKQQQKKIQIFYQNHGLQLQQQIKNPIWWPYKINIFIVWKGLISIQKRNKKISNSWQKSWTNPLGQFGDQVKLTFIVWKKFIVYPKHPQTQFAGLFFPKRSNKKNQSFDQNHG